MTRQPRRRVVVVATGSRVAPGLLSAVAWRHLAEAAAVVLAPDHPALPALVDAGLPVTASVDPLDLLSRMSGLTVHLPAAGNSGAEVGAQLAAAGVETELVRGSWDPPGSHLVELVAVMDRLRSPGGCPWDGAQSHESLTQYLLEEAYEVLEAIETCASDALREELGDVLLQVVFHARIAAEATDGGFDIDDVADAITAKLRRRHPHVFAGAEVGDAAQTERDWDAIKRAEKGRTSALDGVPMAQPALLLAAKLLGRVDRAGLSVPLPTGNGIGDDLLATVAAARAAQIEPESALRDALRRYCAAVRVAESGVDPTGA